WQGQLECQIETSLSFRQPAPPSIRKRGVPFIPETTGFVAELRTSRQLKVDRLIRTFQTDVERRSGFDNLSDLTEIFERPISPRNDRGQNSQTTTIDEPCLNSTGAPQEGQLACS